MSDYMSCAAAPLGLERSARDSSSSLCKEIHPAVPAQSPASFGEDHSKFSEFMSDVMNRMHEETTLDAVCNTVVTSMKKI